MSEPRDRVFQINESPLDFNSERGNSPPGPCAVVPSRSTVGRSAGCIHSRGDRTHLLPTTRIREPCARLQQHATGVCTAHHKLLPVAQYLDLCRASVSRGEIHRRLFELLTLKLVEQGAPRTVAPAPARGRTEEFACYVLHGGNDLRVVHVDVDRWEVSRPLPEIHFRCEVSGRKLLCLPLLGMRALPGGGALVMLVSADRNQLSRVSGCRPCQERVVHVVRLASSSALLSASSSP